MFISTTKKYTRLSMYAVSTDYRKIYIFEDFRLYPYSFLYVRKIKEWQVSEKEKY